MADQFAGGLSRTLARLLPRRIRRDVFEPALHDLRTREIGTRLALGARPRDILLLVMRWGTVLAITGVVIGGAAGLAAAQSLKSMLYGVTTTDPRVLAGAVGVLIVTALAASVIPARRASKTDPARTLSN